MLQAIAQYQMDRKKAKTLYKLDLQIQCSDAKVESCFRREVALKQGVHRASKLRLRLAIITNHKELSPASRFGNRAHLPDCEDTKPIWLRSSILHICYTMYINASHHCPVNQRIDTHNVVHVMDSLCHECFSLS